MKCKKCGVNYPNAESSFYKRKNSVKLYQPCKKCKANNNSLANFTEQQKLVRSTYLRLYRQLDSEKSKEQNKKYYINKKTKLLGYPYILHQPRKGSWNKGISEKGLKAHTEEGRKRISEFQKNRVVSEETRRRMCLAKSGKNHPNWMNGLSKNPYPIEFNAKLKLKIRTRDNFTCCLCGKTEQEELEKLNRALCVNHIDFNKSNCKENNLNTLCSSCNIKINRKREYWTNYFNTQKIC